MQRNIVVFFQRLSQILFLPALAIVIWGELLPGGGNIHIWDKLLHFTAYFGLAAIAAVAIGRLRPALWSGLALAAFGGILEIVQSFVGRDAEWGDEVANVIGVCTGLAAALLFLRALRWIFADPAGRSSNERGNHGRLR